MDFVRFDPVTDRNEMSELVRRKEAGAILAFFRFSSGDRNQTTVFPTAGSPVIKPAAS